jgi:hypothetical protein
MTTSRLVTILQGITACGALSAVLLLAWPADTRVAPMAPVLPVLAANVAPPPQPSAAAMTDSIVNANLFSLTRTAPDDRTFAAAPSDAVIDASPAESFSADAVVDDSLTGGAMEPVPQLYGVVDGPNGLAALLRLDGASRSARLYREGDGAAGYRVRRIGADRVEMDGPSGGVVLHLHTKGKAP